MKSNRGYTSNASSGQNLHQALSREKETLVSMFLCSASHNEINEQIKKIDELCIKLDQRQDKGPAE